MNTQYQYKPKKKTQLRIYECFTWPSSVFGSSSPLLPHSLLLAQEAYWEVGNSGKYINTSSI